MSSQQSLLRCRRRTVSPPVRASARHSAPLSVPGPKARPPAAMTLPGRTPAPNARILPVTDPDSLNPIRGCCQDSRGSRRMRAAAGASDHLGGVVAGCLAVEGALARRDSRALHRMGDPACCRHQSSTTTLGSELAAVPARPGRRDRRSRFLHVDTVLLRLKLVGQRERLLQVGPDLDAGADLLVKDLVALRPAEGFELARQLLAGGRRPRVPVPRRPLGPRRRDHGKRGALLPRPAGATVGGHRHFEFLRSAGTRTKRVWYVAAIFPPRVRQALPAGALQFGQS